MTDARDYIRYDNDKKIYFLEKSPDIYKDKIILLYGKTDSGKSTILLEILYLLKEIVSIPIVFSPTNHADREFDDIIPDVFIYKDVDIEKLEEIWCKQEERTIIYDIANDISILKSLFDKIAGEHERHQVKLIVNRTNNALEDLNIRHDIDRGIKRSEKRDIERKRNKVLKRLFKNQIRRNKNTLMDMDLDDDEKTAIEYIDFNPRIVIIFDDCMSTAKKWDKEEIVKKLFFQGRKYYITQIYTLQDDHGIPPDLRKNAMYSIFTSSNVASIFFETKSNGISRDEKKEAKKIIEVIFKEKRGCPPHYQKLVYNSSKNDKFMYTIADINDDFRVGSSYIWKYTDKLPRKSLAPRKRRSKLDFLSY